MYAIKRVVEKNELEMEVIVNPKHLERGIDVVQLETAAGAAIKNFKGACGNVCQLISRLETVPRSKQFFFSMMSVLLARFAL